MGLLFLFHISLFGQALAAEPPKMILLKTYQKGQDVVGWWMSEKLDGVRAQWDGQHLVSRGGHVFSAPKSFLKGFPPYALDGELWTQRKDFENIVSIVRQKVPDQRWDKVTFNVFEVPDQSGGLESRLSVLKVYLQAHRAPHLRIIPQTKIRSQDHLNLELKRLIALGAEGLVIRAPGLPYMTGRQSSALKLKPFLDDECQLVGTTPGKGKYQGQVGALVCLWQGQEVLIGSGLTDQDRKAPPEMGAWLTFKYYGLTASGRPRFPVFLRVRLDQ